MTHRESKQRSSAPKGTLLQRLEQNLDVLRDLQGRLKRKPPPEDVPSDDEAASAKLSSALQQLAGAMEGMVTARRSEHEERMVKTSESRLARVLLLTGCGARFEPTVLRAVREYRIAEANVRHCSRLELPEPIKLDLLARFREQLDVMQQTLDVLEIQSFHPAVGEAFDSRRHRVVQVIDTVYPDEVERVEEVLHSGFEWQDDLGESRIIQAHVSVFARKNSSAQSELKTSEVRK